MGKESITIRGKKIKLTDYFPNWIQEDHFYYIDYKNQYESENILYEK